MPLASYFAKLVEPPFTVLTATGKTVIVHCLLNNTHTSDVMVDIVKQRGSDTIYLACGLKLPAANRQPYLLPLKGLLLENNEVLKARAYGAGPEDVDWPTANWNSFDWNASGGGGGTVTMSTVDLHITVST